MRYGWLISFALAGAAVFVGGCDMDFKKVDNPDYAAWKNFPVGSGYEFEGMQQAAAENPKRIQISANLLACDKTQVTIKRRTQIFNPGGAGQLDVSDVTIPARINKAENPLTQEDVQDNFRGWDSVLIGDKLYSCEVHYYIVKHDAERFGVKTQGETGMKIWQCKKIPGGIAKIEITGLSPDHLFTLSGQVVNVNTTPGIAPRTVTATSQPADETPTTQETPETQSAEDDSELQDAIASPEHLPIMPEPSRKMQTSGLNTSTTQPSEDEQAAPKVILPVEKPETEPKAFEETPEKIEPVTEPATRKPDPKLLSEMEENSAPEVVLPVTSQPADEPAVKPTKLVAPEKIENDSEPLPGVIAPANNASETK